MKAIVLYYSKTGTTAKIAKRICRDLGCPMVKVEPDVVYGGFLSSVKRVILDRKNHMLPGYVTDIPDLTKYDTVFVGYPVWAGGIPDHMAAFLEDCDLDGKRVVPFATFQFTDITGSLAKLQEICGDADIVFPFSYGVRKREDYGDWLMAVKKLDEEPPEDAHYWTEPDNDKKAEEQRVAHADVDLLDHVDAAAEAAAEAVEGVVTPSEEKTVGLEDHIAEYFEKE